MTGAGSRLGSGAPRANPLAGAVPARREWNAPEEGLALLGLGAVVALLFWPALLGRRVFFDRDILSYWLPQVTSFVRAVAAEGAWPLWSPLFAFGQPMLEDPSYQVLYPLTWLNLLVEPGAYYVLFVALHGLWAGLGLYRFGRTLGLGGLDAWTAAAVFCASGPFLSAANMHHHFAGLAWAPWVLLGLDRVLSAATVRAGLTLGGTAALQALAGSGDLCLMTAALCLGHVAWSWVCHPERRRSWPRALACLSLAAAFALGLSAAQILPAAALLRSAPRAALNPQTNMYWSLHPASLLDLFVDRVVAGFPMNQALRASLFESRGPFLASLYLGLPTVLLVALGAFSPGRLRWGPWLLVGFGLCLLGALGRHAPLLPLLLKIPAIGILRYPAKLLLPASLLWALLVGVGSMAWQRTWAAADRRRGASVAAFGLVVGAGVLLAAQWVDGHPSVLKPLAATMPDQPSNATTVFADTSHALRVSALAVMAAAGVLAARLAFARPPAWLSAALLAAVVGNLVAAGQTVQPLVPAALLHHRPPLLERLAPGDGIRVLSVGGGTGLEPVRGPAGWDPAWAGALGAVERLSAPSSVRWRIAGSFDGDFTGLAPHAQAALSRCVLSDRGSALAQRLLALGSVDYVISVGEAGFPGLEPVAEFPSVFAEPIRLSKVPDPLPKIYWVSRARFVPEGDRVLAALADPSFDPRAEVVLTGGVASPGPAGSRATWRVVERRSDRLRLEISSDGPGYLVFVEAYAPGWRARIDASSVPLLRANALFRAVHVPEGAHTIESAYRPKAASVGGGVSALTLLAGIALWVHRGRRRGDAAG